MLLQESCKLNLLTYWCACHRSSLAFKGIRNTVLEVDTVLTEVVYRRVAHAYVTRPRDFTAIRHEVATAAINFVNERLESNDGFSIRPICNRKCYIS